MYVMGFPTMWIVASAGAAVAVLGPPARLGYRSWLRRQGLTESVPRIRRSVLLMVAGVLWSGLVLSIGWIPTLLRLAVWFLTALVAMYLFVHAGSALSVGKPANAAAFEVGELRAVQIVSPTALFAWIAGVMIAYGNVGAGLVCALFAGMTPWLLRRLFKRIDRA
jgi:hypothetical protein